MEFTIPLDANVVLYVHIAVTNFDINGSAIAVHASSRNLAQLGVYSFSVSGAFTVIEAVVVHVMAYNLGVRNWRFIGLSRANISLWKEVRGNFLEVEQIIIDHSCINTNWISCKSCNTKIWGNFVCYFPLLREERASLFLEISLHLDNLPVTHCAFVES